MGGAWHGAWGRCFGVPVTRVFDLCPPAGLCLVGVLQDGNACTGPWSGMQCARAHAWAAACGVSSGVGDCGLHVTAVRTQSLHSHC